MVRSKVVIRQTTSGIGKSIGIKGVACTAEASISSDSSSPGSAEHYGKTIQQSMTFHATSEAASDDRGSSRSKVCYSSSVGQSTKRSV